MVSVNFVISGSRLLGVLYGANAGTPDSQLASNQIFSRWLQKRVLITDSSGVQYLAQGGYGPDRQWFQHLPREPSKGLWLFTLRTA